MKPSVVLDKNRAFIYDTVLRYRTKNPRVFGSVLTGKDSDNSDLDLLVDPMPETTLFDLGGLQYELESRLGIKIDVLTPADLPEKFRDQVLFEAQPV